MTVKKFDNFDEENNKWIIYHGLGGGFGGARSSEAFEGTKDEAETESWNKACEDYDRYAGLHGLRSISDIMEEKPIQASRWLDYWVVPYNEEGIREAKNKTNFTDLK